MIYDGDKLLPITTELLKGNKLNYNGYNAKINNIPVIKDYYFNHDYFIPEYWGRISPLVPFRLDPNFVINPNDIIFDEIYHTNLTRTTVIGCDTIVILLYYKSGIDPVGIDPRSVRSKGESSLIWIHPFTFHDDNRKDIINLFINRLNNTKNVIRYGYYFNFTTHVTELPDYLSPSTTYILYE